MKTSHLIVLLKETGLSPEALGSRFGVSGMSIRRWLKGAPSKIIPEPYESAVHMTIQRLIAEGSLGAQSKSARWSWGEVGALPFQASMTALGCEAMAVGEFEGQDSKVISMLQKTGSAKHCKAEVEQSSDEISAHKKHSPEWAERISLLMKVVGSKNLLAIDKLVAFGALFYLVFPFDLIPDTIPIVGLVDDFAILGIAATYYLNRNALDA